LIALIAHAHQSERHFHKELFMKKFTSFLLSLCAVFTLIPCGFGCGDEGISREFKNVIVVIGDGMGENHILNAIDYFDLETPSFMADQKDYIVTNSMSGTTDSAAGATALATGRKVINGNVAQLAGQNLEQITQIARKAKMKTGIVTTDTLDGATPAGFSAHANDRGDTEDIIRTQAESNINLFLGQQSGSYRFHKNYFTQNNYTIVENKDALLKNKKRDKLLGHIKDIGSEYIIGNEENFQLKDMAEFAVEYLENKNGFFLMIEGAYIDKYSHSNAFDQAMCEMRSLIDTLEYLYDYASDGETAIFFTADHETGGLQRANDETEMNNWLYTSTGHTSTNVPLFVKNYVFNAQDFGYGRGEMPQNTVVFDACKAIIEGTK
jgi:alkaline phosphatase